METLALKLNVLVGLFGYVGLFGLAALLVTLIWLIIRVANFDSVLPALLCLALSIALTAGGLVTSPTPNAQPEPLIPPWEAPLAALKEQIGKFKENPPWARFLKDKADSPEAGDLAGMERMDVVHTSAPPDSITEQDKILVEETLSGWRVRLTLPREWKSICVVENNGERLSFYQKASMQNYGGLVFFLTVADSPVDPAAPEFEDMDGLQVVAEKDGAALISAGPTDIQYNYSVTELSDEYDRMRAEISGILDTLEFERA